MVSELIKLRRSRSCFESKKFFHSEILYFDKLKNSNWKKTQNKKYKLAEIEENLTLVKEKWTVD